MDSSDNYFSDDHDLKFHVQNYPWDEVLSLLPPNGEKEGKDSVVQDACTVLEAVGSLIAKEFAPKADALSEQSPTLNNGTVTQTPLMQSMVSKLAEIGAMGTSVSPEYGGMGLPVMLGHAITQMLARADVPLSNVYAYYLGGAKVLETFQGYEDFSEIISHVAAGQALGAMALTEPQAGSDLSQVRTRATQQPDGSWQVQGQKIWITCGHAEHHFVLARSKTGKENEGLKGLSLFYVPAFLKDGQRNIEVSGLEKKIGHHPIVTATINYDKSKATLLGKEGEGFSLMLHLMNHARVSTASMALGLCEHVSRVARTYAKQRITMGQPIAEHPMIADYLQDMEVTTQGIRALLFECLFHEDMEFRLRMKLKSASEDEKVELNKRLNHHYWQARSLTPLVKYFATEEGVRLSRLAIQILGGVGYMKEYGLGRFHQDSLLLPIYEGTSQIQSLMVLKDRLKSVFRSPTKFIQEIAKNRFDLIKELDPLQRKLTKMRYVYQQFIQAFILDALSDQFKTLAGTSFRDLTTAWKKDWDPKKSMQLGLQNAERFTKVCSYLSASEALLKRVDQSTDANETLLRKEIAGHFLRIYEIRCRHALEELKNSD
jgi:alkylation response protein AidB-like acyl-CoA dehydrogenase